MKRWILRSFSIALLLACLGMWAWSYTGRTPLIGYARYATFRTSFQYMAKLDRGILHVCHSRYCGAYPKGCFCLWRTWRPPTASKSAFLGFYTDHGKDFFFHWSGIPLWSPAILCAAGLFLTWRWTRPRPPGHAFPVELAQTTTPQ